MTQPFIDCAIALARDGVAAADVVDVECEVGEGTVHRLWEPLATKHRPPTPYAAKFSTPFCMAVGFVDGKAGFAGRLPAVITGEVSRSRVAENDPAARRSGGGTSTRRGAPSRP